METSPANAGEPTVPDTSATRTWIGAFAVLLALGAFMTVLAWLEPAPPPPPAAQPAAPAPLPREPAAPAALPKGVTLWPPGNQDEDDAWTGRLERLEGNLAILTVRGTPKFRGAAHGHLLRAEVQRLVAGVRDFVRPDAERDAAKYRQALAGARTMGRFLDADVMDELRACAEAAEVDADELLLAQLFGDVNRAEGFASFCSSFAAFGPATNDGKLVVGRNFDYAGHGLEKGLPLILQELPSSEAEGRPFVTIGYAGILNGWTAMNDAGLCASNNTLFGGVDSLEGISTCFLLRKIVQRTGTVEEAVRLVESSQRACTTGMLVAGKNAAGAWDARFVEFDHKATAVVEPVGGRLLSTNTRQKLTFEGLAPPRGEPGCSRWLTLKAELERFKGTLRFDELAHNAIARSGVYMSINLHSAQLDPSVGAQRFRLAVEQGDGRPAAEQRWRVFKVEPKRVVEVVDGR